MAVHPLPGEEYPLPGVLPETLQLITAKNGSPSLLSGSRSVHSRYNPEQEAAKTPITGREAAVLFGFGLGYQALYWFSCCPDSPLLVIEPEPVFVAAAVQCGLLDRLQGRPVFFSAAADSAVVRRFLRSLTPTQLKAFSVLTTPGRIAGTGDRFRILQQRFQELLTEHLTNLFTEWEFERLWFRNWLLNGTALPAALPLQRLAGTLKGKTVLLAGAGPGLREQLPVIRQIRRRIILFAVDTAYRTLEHAGITADFVVSLDAQIHNYQDFAGITPSPQTALLCDLSTYPAIPRLPFRTVYFFETADFQQLDDGRIALISQPAVLWIKQCCGEPGPVRSGGNVTTSAVEIIRISGAEQILFAGCDYAYRYGISHAPETPAHTAILNSSYRWKTPEQQAYRSMLRRALIPAPANTPGKTVQSDMILQKYARWTADACREEGPHTRWYSLDPLGSALPGIRFLSGPPTLPFDSAAFAVPAAQPCGGEACLKERYTLLRNAISDTVAAEERDFLQECLPLLEQFPFLKKTFSAQLLHFDRLDDRDRQRKFLIEELKFQLKRTLRTLERALLPLRPD